MVLSDGTLKYVYGNGLADAVDGSGNLQVYHTDGLGSVRAITNGSGTLLETYQTDPFGVTLQAQGSSSQPFQFTGPQQDAETSFYYLRARYYDPATGRFLSRDTVAGDLTSPRSLNRFIYVTDDPVGRVDPSGLEGDCGGGEGSSDPMSCLGGEGFVGEGGAGEAYAGGLDTAARAVADGSPGTGGATIDLGGAVASVERWEQLHLPFADAASEEEPRPGDNVSVAGETAGSEAVGGLSLTDVARGIHGRLDPIARSLRTTAALKAVAADDTETVIVASSERALTRSQLAAVDAIGGIAAEGPGHAEVTALDEALRRGLRPVEVAASRPICPACAKIIGDLGIEPLSPLR